MFPSIIELSALDGTTGFALNGAAADDQSGRSVASAGDVNGDGIDDLIVGARRADPNGTNSGRSYVVFGSSGGFASEIELSSLDGASGFALNGAAADDFSGVSVASAGDVNGDGIDDLIVGAFGADPNGDASGSSYVVFGSSGGFASEIELSALDGAAGFALNGAAAGDESGDSVASAGDVNGDGINDLIVGARRAAPNGSYSGRSYVVFGSSGGFAAEIELSALDGATGFALNGASAGDQSGVSVASAGDVNGDGIDDLIVGAWGADPNGSSSGRSYVVFGSSGGFAPEVELSALDGATGFALNGAAASDFSGRSVASAGDVNGDGIADLIVGASGADPNGSSSGRSYVVFGSSGGFASEIELSALAGATGFVLNGAAQGDRSGRSIASAGDVNGDGFDDLIVGAPFADPNGSSSGRSYVVFGSSNGFASEIELSALDGATGFALNGAALGDRVGYSVASAGDVNGDGIDDLIVGAHYADPNGSSSGRSYVVFGNADVVAVDDAFAVAVDAPLAGANVLANDGSAAETFVVSFTAEGVTAPAGGAIALASGAALSVAADGTVALTQNGAFSGLLIGGAETVGFDYEVRNTGGGADAAAAVVTVIGANPTPAVFPSVVALSSLDGTTGFALNGAAAFDRSGFSVASAGDVNGDGIDDLIVGAPFANANGSDSGRSYVVFGSSGGFASGIELSALDGSTGFALNGAAAGDESGVSVASAGDVNGDGFDDLIVGAWRVDSLQGAGRSYVVFGASGGFASEVELSALDGSTGFALNGPAISLSGRSVAAAGDVNGDGIDDLIVGAPYANASGTYSGRSYVVFGSSGGFASEIDLSALDGAAGFALNGGASRDYSGWSVASAGDVNGDGIDDLAVGAFGSDANGFRSGRAYVVFGSSGGFAPGIALASLDGGAGFALNGAAANDHTGISVASAGDVNGDGIDDLIVGAFGADPNGSSSGRAYVVFGASTGFASEIELSALDGAAGFALNGGASRDYSGWSVSAAGDVNGDGIDDLIVGAPEADPNGSDSGRSYVLFGSRRGFAPQIELSALDGITGFALDGAAAGDRSGGSVAAAGDVNGDGVDDLIVGANYSASNGASSGRSYVLFGVANLAGVDDAFAVAADAPLAGANVLANDRGGRGARVVASFTAEGTTAAAGASITLANGAALSVAADGTVALTQNGAFVALAAGETEALGFDYEVSDGEGGSDVAAAVVAVTGVDDAPAAVDDAATVAEDGTVTGEVLANDSDPDVSDVLAVASVGGSAANLGAPLAGAFGTLTLNADGSWSYAADRADALIAGETGTDVFVYALAGGSEATLTIEVAGADETLRGGRAANDLVGGRGDDRLFGRGGDDRLDGGRGDDFLNGGTGDDVLLGRAGADTLVGGGGNDRLVGGGGRDILRGGAGNDVLLGRAGADTLVGENGNDRLVGGGGDDVLRGGKGRDTIQSGAGSDVLMFRRGDGRDTVLDWRDGQDVIHIETGARNFRQLGISERRGDVLIDYGARGDQIRLRNADADDLDAGDFVFG